MDSRVADEDVHRDVDGDVEGDVDGDVEGDEAPDGVDPETAQRFATAFLATIVTAERAADIVAHLVGPVVRLGPEPIGPRGLATVTAEGRPGRIRGRRIDARTVVVTVPMTLDVEVAVADRSVRQDIEIDVRVRVHPHLTADPAVTADVEPVARHDVDVRAGGRLTGVLLRRLGLEDEVRTRVVDHVRDVLATPTAQAACRIDLAELADRAWDSALVLPPGVDPAEDLQRAQRSPS